jgi:hypothetical protein
MRTTSHIRRTVAFGKGSNRPQHWYEFPARLFAVNPTPPDETWSAGGGSEVERSAKSVRLHLESVVIVQIGGAVGLIHAKTTF